MSVASTKVYAVVRPKLNSFEEGSYVQSQKKFWNVIFTEIPASTTVIHDANHPDVIIDLLDYTKLPSKLGVGTKVDRKKRERITQQYMRRYQIGLDRFRALKEKARQLGAIEERIYNVYKKSSPALRDLYHGRVVLRSQAGLSDEFERAAVRASTYLPYMERIFAEEGLPTELTRLAFVESMFNPKAISKVGASGIWQFMPDTARQFMTVSRYIDERNSPLKASRAAARLLALNYRILGSWPLAVTAYNHGAGSLQRAIRKLGSNDFESILRDYDDRNFGFASKNFYAEFLSAKAIYQQKFRPSEPHSPNPLAITSLKLRRPVSLRQLTAAISREELLSHNPCILPAGINAFQSRPLPIGYELFVPINLRQKIQTAAIESSAHLYREKL